MDITDRITAALRTAEPEPEVGMGCTLLGWTDRYAATVIAVERPTITVQRDSAMRVDDNGTDGEQVYLCTPDPRGRRVTFRQRTDGTYAEVMKNGRGKYILADGGGYGLKLGIRRPYRDPRF